MSEQNNSNKNSHNSTSRLILEKLTSLEDNLNDYKKTTDSKLTSIVQTSSSSRILEKLISLENTTELKLTNIVHTLSSLNTKVDNVVSEVSTLKNDMSTIKNNVSTLKNDVIDLRSNFNIYIKQTSLYEEDKYNNLIYHTLMNKLSGHISKYKIENIYDIHNNRISDIDGCILMNLVSSSPNKFANNVIKDVNPTNANLCIFIEAKRSLNKSKFDNKLKQILKFKNLLIDIHDKNKKIKLHSELDKSILEHSLKTFTQTIYIIFGSEDIPIELKRFILLVNRGITKEEYDELIFSLFKTDQTYIFTKYDNKVSDEKKKRLNAINTLEELKDYCKEPDSLKTFHHYMEEFKEFEGLYTKFKGILGILHINTLIVPGLIKIEDTTEIKDVKDYISNTLNNNTERTRTSLKNTLKLKKSSVPTPP